MKRFVLIGILVGAAFLRLYVLSQVPPAPSLDEVSIGYNAYSILHTGKDEYGTSFPLLLRAYDDWRPALYVYLVVPFVWVFGLGQVAVRLPSVVLSLLTVYAAWAIGRLIGKKYLSFPWLGEIMAGLLAISPWHIYISRLGHEANLGSALFVLGIYFLLHAVIENRFMSWIFAASALGLSLHGYQSEKIIVPVVLLAAAMLFRHQIIREKRGITYGVLTGLVFVIPALFVTLTGNGMERLRGTSAFSPDSPVVMSYAQRYAVAKSQNDRVGQLLVSRYVAYAVIFSGNYFSHFSPAWLFTGADREAHKVPGMGLLYLWEAPLLLIGFWALMKSKIPRYIRWFLFICLISAPLPASITTQAPHAMRSYTFIPLLQFLEALGAWYVYRIVKKPYLPIAAIAALVCVMFFLGIFWNGYFIRFPLEQSDSFQSAMKRAVAYAIDSRGKYTGIQFSNSGSMYQSYMFFLFYSGYDPKQYQLDGGTRSGGFAAAHYFGPYSFGVLPSVAEDMKPHTLYLYDSELLPSYVRVLERFTDARGKDAVIAVEKTR